MRSALGLAYDFDLDLVEVAPMSDPPVCKIMNYSKFKYEADTKARAAKRHQSKSVTKEMKFRPTIDPHDYETKKNQIEKFLRHHDRVKVTVMLRGREQSRPDLGRKLLLKLAEDVADVGKAEATPYHFGRNVTMLLVPLI